jgi:hypothetical protein
MTTTEKFARPSLNRSVGASLRHAWHESVAAHRAMMRLTPYFDAYRQDGR